VIFFHGDTAAPLADIFHGGQFVFADMFGIDHGSPAEAAIFGVTAGVAQMSGFFGNRTAGFACISHIVTSFSGYLLVR
jgi:hypothetical protein